MVLATSEVYGDPEVVPQAETYFGNVNCFGPRSCYDEGKRIEEALAYAYQRKHGVQIRIARIFNTYGPSMRIQDGRAVPNFIAAALDGRPITIYGDGSATRSFQFVTDCISGLMALMNSDYASPVNIGNDLETSVGDIATLIADLVAAKIGQKGNPTTVAYLPARKDDPHRRKPDISLAREVLGWRPTVELREGLAATVDYFIQKRKMQMNAIDEPLLGTGMASEDAPPRKPRISAEA